MSRLSSRPVTALELFGPGGIKERAQHPTVAVLLRVARLDWDTSGGRHFKGVFECTLHLKQKLAYFLIPSNCAVAWKVSQFLLIATACHFAAGELLTLWLSIALSDLFCACPAQSSQARCISMSAWQFFSSSWPDRKWPLQMACMLFPHLAVTVAVLKALIVWQIEHLSGWGESSNCPSVICLLWKNAWCWLWSCY